MNRDKIAFVKAVATLVVAGYVVGCVHDRVTLMVSVPDIGPQIVTKNKYTLVYGDGKHFMFSGVSLDRLIVAQPQVFGSNGIPVVVKCDRRPSSQRGSGPFIVPMLVPFLIPGCQEGSTDESLYTIDVVDCPDARATFRKKERWDGCFAILSPLPMLFYPTAGSFDDEPENKCKFTRHFFSLGLSSDTSLSEGIISVNESATAYGIAVALKQMEESGKIKPANSRPAEDVVSQGAVLGLGRVFDVVDFHKTDSDSYRYVFSLVSTNEIAFAAKRVLDSTIRNDFMASFPSANRTVLAVDFIEYEFENSVIKGVAIVMPLNILAYNYEKHTRKGYMRIKVRADQVEVARRYVKQNIESVVRDKNIALIVGEMPPHARFELLDESVVNDVLEINFKAE